MKYFFLLLLLFLSSFLYSQTCGQIDSSISYPTTYPSCLGAAQQFTATSSFGSLPGLTFQWENESSVIISDTSVLNYTFNQSGADTIFLVANYIGCPTNYYPIAFYIYNNPETILDLGPDISICEGETADFNASVSGLNVTYKWSTNATTANITVSNSGTYSVTVTSTCSVGAGGRDTVRITIIPKPTVNLGGDRVVCSGIPVILDAGNNTATYLWSTGATTQTISVNDRNITIGVQVDSSGCIGGDTITITDCPVEAQLPNAFSPNGDGKNDVLYVRGNNISELDLKIFNRLGNMVYHNTSVSEGWDGSYQGKIQESDVYVYILTGKMNDGTTFEKSGSVALIK